MIDNKSLQKAYFEALKAAVEGTMRTADMVQNQLENSLKLSLITSAALQEQYVNLIKSWFDMARAIRETYKKATEEFIDRLESSL